MAKFTKSKKEFEVKPIKEPDFLTNTENADPTAGANKKLLAQKQREQRDEEIARINKEKQEAENKQKNKSKKTKTKQNQNQTQTQIEQKEMISVKTEIEHPKTKIDESQDSLNFEKSDSNLNNRFGRISFTFGEGKNDKDFQAFLKSGGKYAGKVREKKGDLFTAPDEYSLAHCVAEDFSMGAGIAKEFRAKFRGLSKLLAQGAKTGGLAVLPHKERFIYYLVTKAYSRGKPTLYTLWKSLLKLRDHIAAHKVTKLAIPQIGCGLDRLDWNEVKHMLEYVFKDNNIEIVVYILDFNWYKSGYSQINTCPTPAKVPKLDLHRLTCKRLSQEYTFDLSSSESDSNIPKRKYIRNPCSHPPGLKITTSPSKKSIKFNSDETSNSSDENSHNKHRSNKHKKRKKSKHKSSSYKSCQQVDNETSFNSTQNESKSNMSDIGEYLEAYKKDKRHKSKKCKEKKCKEKKSKEKSKHSKKRKR